ncbi:hypothetical protein Tco_0360977 [Tanacetum coccineum]
MIRRLENGRAVRVIWRNFSIVEGVGVRRGYYQEVVEEEVWEREGSEAIESCEDEVGGEKMCDDEWEKMCGRMGDEVLPCRAIRRGSGGCRIQGLERMDKRGEVKLREDGMGNGIDGKKRVDYIGSYIVMEWMVEGDG